MLWQTLTGETAGDSPTSEPCTDRPATDPLLEMVPSVDGDIREIEMAEPR